jgi:diadenosine tetraphosphate (Ap4A) HIT family hydrolase
MLVIPKKAQSHKESPEIGPRPWHHRSDCFVCRKQEGLEAPPSGGYIVEGKYFLVEHAPLKMSHVGTVIIESRRHLLDFGEMTSAESTEFGSIMRRLVPAVKTVTGTDRIYYLSVNEHAPHFHLCLVPKLKNTKLEPLPFLSRRAVSATKSGAAAISRKIRKQYDRP